MSTTFFQKRLAFFLLGLLVLTFFTTRLAAAQGSPTLEASWQVEGDVFNVGDPIQLQLEVSHLPDQAVILPQLPETWGDFRLVSVSPPLTEDQDDQAITRVNLDVRLFAPGSFSTPPLEVTVADSSGALSKVVAQPISLDVASILTDGDSELRDIKPQAALPFTNLSPFVAGALLLIAVLLVFWWYRRRQMLRALAAEDDRTPYEVAIDNLQAIEERALADQGLFKTHFSLTTDVIRRFVEQQYQVPLMERTTAEARLLLADSAISSEGTSLLIPFLQSGDLVKFSDYPPSGEEAADLLVTARQILELLKPLVITTADVGRSQNGESDVGPAEFVISDSDLNSAMEKGFSSNGRVQHNEVQA